MKKMILLFSSITFFTAFFFGKVAAQDTAKKSVRVIPHWKIRGHMGVYGSYGICYAPGTVIVPETENEFFSNFPGRSFSQVSTTHPPGKSYSGGMEFMPKGDGPMFVILGLGFSGYHYGGTATDVFYAENTSGLYVNQGTQSFNYYFDLYMADFSVHLMGAVAEWPSGRVSTGIGIRAAYVTSQDNSGYNPPKNFTNIPAESYYSSNVDFISGHIQFDHNVGDNELIFAEVYYNYAIIGLPTNGLASVGLKIGVFF